MNIIELTEKLSEIAVVEVIKKDFVFTLFMTGDNLTKWSKFNKIQTLVTEFLNGEMPTIEVLKNEETFFLMIMKP